MPFTNWRGDYEHGYFSGMPECTQLSSTCLFVDWPAPKVRVYRDGMPKATGDWVGSLLQEQQDESGLLYQRNRYYDPMTGQFTKMDPIGLAGGLNLYGFAAGDPVNFSDPFGLCPIEVDGVPCSLEWGAKGLAVGATTGAAVVGAAGTLVLPGGGTVVGAGGGFVLGGAIGATAGVISGSIRDIVSFSAGSRIRRFALAALLGLSANPQVQTTPTNPCGDEIKVECIDHQEHSDTVRTNSPADDPKNETPDELQRE